MVRPQAQVGCSLLQLRDIRVSYPTRNEPILNGLDYDLQPGQSLSIVSPNGGGKTTLLNYISGVIPTHIQAVTQGSVQFDGIDITRLPLCDKLLYLSYQMADPDTQFFFPTLDHELSFAPENLGRSPGSIRASLDLAMERFGLRPFSGRDATTLSTGQKKLLLWAICEVIDAPVVLLDEPSAGLSPKGIERLLDWLADLSSRGKIVLIAEHDPRIIAACSARLELG